MNVERLVQQLVTSGSLVANVCLPSPSEAVLLTGNIRQIAKGTKENLQYQKARQAIANGGDNSEGVESGGLRSSLLRFNLNEIAQFCSCRRANRQVN